MNNLAPEVHPNAADVCAIAVTYHPDPGFTDRIGRIVDQVGALIIVDNGSSEAQIQMLHRIAADPSITLHLNHANLGVASALNIGIQLAIKRGFAWVLLLDQDTVADADMVQRLLAARSAYPHPEILAVIGAGFRDVNKDMPAEAQDSAPAPWEEAKNVITSGSMIPLSSHAAVGPFREEFFIDHVDMEYCFRARAKGFRIIRTRKPIMLHAIGAYTQHRWLWKKRWTTNHSADRRYFFARNDTVMLREYGNYSLGLWRLKSLRRCLRVCERIVLYEDSKAAKIAAVAQGWWDGICGNLGPRRRANRE